MQALLLVLVDDRVAEPMGLQRANPTELDLRADAVVAQLQSDPSQVGHAEIARRYLASPLSSL